MKKVISYFATLIFFPHQLLFLFSDKKDIIIRDLYARSNTKTSKSRQMIDLSRELIQNSYFRNLFYFRTRGFFSKVLRIFYPQNKTFIIDINSEIGAGLQLAHPYSTIINAHSLGENCYINHLVTIGEKSGLKPTIGNNVQLHANSMVIGGVIVGDNAIIGAGAVVVKDVPENAVVVGNPAKIIKFSDK